jgi:hypothetical protein
MPHGIFHHPLDFTGSGLSIHDLADVGMVTKMKGDKILFLGKLEEVFEFLLILWLGFDVDCLSVLPDMVR